MAILKIDVADDRADDEMLAAMADELQRELRNVEMVTVAPGQLEAPDGVRAGAGADVGTLVLTLAQNPAVLTSVFSTIGSFLGRGRTRTVTVELDGDKLTLSSATPAEQAQLVSAFLAHHG